MLAEETRAVEIAETAPLPSAARKEAPTADESIGGVSVDHADTPLDRVRAAAAQLLGQHGAEVWGRGGTLGPEHLSCSIATPHRDGVATFNVLDSGGYHDSLKCNLFAFELAYRAGLVVPVIGRGRGWSFPNADGLDLMMDGRDRIDGEWARVADRLDIEEIREATDRGEVFMVFGSALRGRPGHLGVMEQVHHLARSRNGRISRLEYTGWEAGGTAARHARFTWGPGRFYTIHLLLLREPLPGEPQVVTLGRAPTCASVLDAQWVDPALTDRAASRSCRPDAGAPTLPVLSSWTRALLEESAFEPSTIDSEQLLQHR